MTRRRLVTSTDAAYWIYTTHATALHPTVIRQWAKRGHIGRHRAGWRCYDLDEVVAEARRRGLLAKD